MENTDVSKKRYISPIVVCMSIVFTWFSIEYGIAIFVKAYSAATGSTGGMKIEWIHPLLSNKPILTTTTFHPYRTFTHLPNLRPFKYYEAGDYTFSTDSYGFTHNGSPRKYLIPKPQDVVRIVLLGGSSAEGHGASGNKTIITAQLEQKLNNYFKDSSQKFEVINGAIGGYFTPNELIYLALDLLKFEPNYVITFDGFNDIWLSLELFQNRQEILPNYSEYQFSAVRIMKQQYSELFHLSSFVEIFGKRLFHNSFELVKYLTYRFCDEACKARKMKKPESDISNSEKFPTCPKELPNITASQYIENLQSIVSIAESRGIKVILTIQPFFWEHSQFDGHLFRQRKDYTDCFLTYYSQIQDMLSDRFQQQVLATFSFVNSFYGKGEYFTDNVHLNDQAQGIVADKLFDLIQADL